MSVSTKSFPHLTMETMKSPNMDSFSLCDADTAVMIIQQYIDKRIFTLSSLLDGYEFKKKSYQQWAACEACHRIMDHPFDDPVTAIESFMLEMDMYACYGEDEPRSFIFQSAAETAAELISLFV